METLIIEEDVVVLMIMFQYLEQGLLGLGACPWECMGAQDRGRKSRRGREETLGDVWGKNFGSSGLASSEKIADGRGHRLLLLCS